MWLKGAPDHALRAGHAANMCAGSLLGRLRNRQRRLQCGFGAGARVCRTAGPRVAETFDRCPLVVARVTGLAGSTLRVEPRVMVQGNGFGKMSAAN